MLTQLQELKNRKFNGNQQYMDITREIAQLKEQTHILARLQTKDFLEEIKYLEQTTTIHAKIEKLSRELKKSLDVMTRMMQSTSSRKSLLSLKMDQN